LSFLEGLVIEDEASGKTSTIVNSTVFNASTTFDSLFLGFDLQFLAWAPKLALFCLSTHYKTCIYIHYYFQFGKLDFFHFVQQLFINMFTLTSGFEKQKLNNYIYKMSELYSLNELRGMIYTSRAKKTDLKKINNTINFMYTDNRDAYNELWPLVKERLFVIRGELKKAEVNADIERAKNYRDEQCVLRQIKFLEGGLEGGVRRKSRRNRKSTTSKKKNKSLRRRRYK
jgi:hypothetical protein